VFPIDQVDWEENCELNTATADDSQNVTDSSDPGVVHIQKFTSEVAEMVDQTNSDTNAKNGVTKTPSQKEMSERKNELIQYLSPKEPAPQGQANQGQPLRSPFDKMQEQAFQGQHQGLPYTQPQLPNGQSQGQSIQRQPQGLPYIQGQIFTFCFIPYYILLPSSFPCHETMNTEDTPLIVVMSHNITSQYKSTPRRTLNCFVTSCW
jgi:hypothetical protein